MKMSNLSVEKITIAEAQEKYLLRCKVLILYRDSFLLP